MTSRNYLMLFLIVAAVILVYLPGLSGPFQFDDYANIVNNDAVKITELNFETLSTAAGSGLSGPLGRPLSYASFAFDHYIAGLSPAQFKRTNLALHLANVLLVFVLLRALLRRLHTSASAEDRSEATAVALLAAGLWGLHPINLTSVLYVVQRMTSLSTLFVLLGLLVYVFWRRRSQLSWGTTSAAWLAIGACLGLGALSKESALLLPLYIAAIELVAFTPWRQAALAHRRLRHTLTLVLPIAVIAALAIVTLTLPQLVSGYESRDFNLMERLLTQARVLWFHLAQLAFPHPHWFSLFHDHFTVSRGWLTPPATLGAVAALVVLLSSAMVLASRYPLWTLCVYLFLSAHVMESTIIPLELAHEHRNYFASIWFCLLAALALVRIRHLAPSRLTQPLIVGILFSTLAMSTASRAQAWNDSLRLAQVQVRNFPDSPRAQSEFAYSLLEQLEQAGEARELHLTAAHLHAVQALALDPDQPIAYFILFRCWMISGNEGDPPWFDDMLASLKTTRRSPDVINQLRSLSSCPESACGEGRVLVARLFEAATENPHVDGWARSELFVAAGQFFARSGHPEMAVSMLAMAAETSPSEPRYRLFLAEMLDHYGRSLDASAEVNRVLEGGVDLPSWLLSRAEALSAKLNALQRGATAP